MYQVKIFREYDVRGVVDRDYDADFARLLGRAFARMLTRAGGSRASVGRDVRLSSPSLAEALIRGMVESGLQVLDLGVVTTPMVYYSLHHLPVDGGIQVTGSHNPPDQNGFKISIGQTTIHGDRVQELRRIIEGEDYVHGAGQVTERPIREEYVEWVSGLIKLSRPLKVVIDSGNGTAGLVGPEILRRIGCEVVELYSEPDGRFPNHHPDPTVPDNLTALIAKVREVGADAGLAFDGDADRIGVVTDAGDIVYGDILLMLLARAVLREGPGATIIGEVKCSHLLFEDIRAHGGNPIMAKAGHSLIKARMREEGAALGGEMSGHIFFQQRFEGYDDAIYAGCRLLELLAAAAAPLSAMVARVPKTFNTPELRIDSFDEKKFEIVRQARDYFKAQGLETIDVDGVRIVWPDGWGLLRASNTQAMLVMRFEAESEARLTEIRKLVEDKVAELNQ